jgi:type I restriction enzyme S subunit
MREDWIECTLDDLLTLKNGFAFKSSKYINNGIPVIRIGDINDWIVDETHSKCVVENVEYDNYIVENGDILIAMSGATTGKFGIYESDNKVYQNQRVGNLIPHSKNLIDKKYIFNLLYSLKYQIEKEAYGGAQPNISAGKIHAMKTLLAPLPEQRAIVAKIEELFSDLDKGIDDIKKAKDQLVIYRQAVLKKAFEGISDSKPLGKFGEWNGGGTPSTQVKEYWENGNIPWVSSRDVKVKDIYETERYITEVAIQNSSTKWIEKDSLLFVMRSGILRRIFPIAIARRNLCVNQDIQTVALDNDWIPEFIYWYLVGNESNIRHTCSKDGTTVESVDTTLLKLYMVPVCSKIEQRKIIKQIESRLSVCDKVEQSISESLEKAKALRQSILKKAFEGKLLSKVEIARCKQEQDYEPAAALLAKIKAEKKK